MKERNVKFYSTMTQGQKREFHPNKANKYGGVDQSREEPRTTIDRWRKKIRKEKKEVKRRKRKRKKAHGNLKGLVSKRSIEQNTIIRKCTQRLARQNKHIPHKSQLLRALLDEKKNVQLNNEEGKRLQIEGKELTDSHKGGKTHTQTHPKNGKEKYPRSRREYHKRKKKKEIKLQKTNYLRAAATTNFKGWSQEL